MVATRGEGGGESKRERGGEIKRRMVKKRMREERKREGV
jgi:hypothetical protein